MNNGAFGENFPYSNFHDLNMDWIIKIAKDFLDQYTHIQEVIQTGLDDLAESRETGLSELDQKRLDSLAELNQKTLDGLTDLQAKYDTLDGLLQAWYDTHSADIAGQLADAIADFNTAAEAKSQALLDSWPADYSELVTEYHDLKNILYGLFNEKKTFIDEDTGLVLGGVAATTGSNTSNEHKRRTQYIGIDSDIILIRTSISCQWTIWTYSGTTQSSAIRGVTGTGLPNATVPVLIVRGENENYFRIGFNKSDDSDFTTIEESEIIENTYICKTTDVTLSKSGIPADAKATGDSIGISRKLIDDLNQINREDSNYYKIPTLEGYTIEGKAYNSSGALTDNVNVHTTDIFTLMGNTIKSSVASMGYAMFDENLAFISRLIIAREEYTFDSNVKYIAIMYGNMTQEEVDAITVDGIVYERETTIPVDGTNVKYLEAVTRSINFLHKEKLILNIMPGEYNIYEELGGDAYVATIGNKSWSNAQPVLTIPTIINGIGDVTMKMVVPSNDHILKQ